MPDEAAARRIRLAGLIIAYSHITVAELVLRGVPPREAFTRAYHLHFEYLAPRAAWANRGTQSLLSWTHPLTGPGGDWAVPIPPGKRWTTRCFTRAADDCGTLLRRTEPEGTPASLLVSAADADRLAWMSEMLRRYATGGGDLPACARGAIDRAASRPRRHRAPVDDAWLATEIDAALTGLWALLQPGLPFTGQARPGTEGR